MIERGRESILKQDSSPLRNWWLEGGVLAVCKVCKFRENNFSNPGYSSGVLGYVDTSDQNEKVVTKKLATHFRILFRTRYIVSNE
jgi:hypothetical protein